MRLLTHRGGDGPWLAPIVDTLNWMWAAAHTPDAATISAGLVLPRYARIDTPKGARTCEIDWTTGGQPAPWVINPTSDVHLEWVAHAGDHTSTGTTLITPTYCEVPAPTTTPVAERDHAGSPPTHDTLESRAQAARYALLARLEPVITRALMRKTHTLTLELTRTLSTLGHTLTSECFHPDVLDDIDMQAMSARILYGPPGAASSPLMRTIDKLLTPGFVSRYGVWKPLDMRIERDAGNELARHCGDQRAGAKIRSLLASGDHTTLDTLITEYNQLTPSRPIARSAALASLAQVLRLVGAPDAPVETVPANGGAA